MAYTPANPNGQATMANSSPVTIASDQTTVRTKLSSDIAVTTGSITSATSTVTATDLTGVGSVTVSFYGTHAGVNAIFEIYDGTNWGAIAAQATNSATPAASTTTGVITTNATVIYNVSPLLGVQQFRVRATAWTSGTCNVIIEPSAQFTQYLINVASLPTVTSVVSGSATTTGQTMFRDMALTNTDVTVKATSGRLYSYYFHNPNTTTDAWVHLYNAAIASVTVGTTVPVWSIYVPAGGTAEREFIVPLSFATAITVAATQSRDYTVTTAPATTLTAEIGYV